MERPFIYIAALPRSGSTVLSEFLTSIPQAFIFHEPRFASGEAAFKNYEVQMLAKVGIDLPAIRRKWGLGQDAFSRLRRAAFGRRSLVRDLAKSLVPELRRSVEQLGVKEISHQNWQEYPRYFKNVKCLLTARDPRDLYISYREAIESGRASWWQGGVSAEEIGGTLIRRFQDQMDMYNALDCMKVKYEAFCSDLLVQGTVRSFVDSPIAEGWSVGAFNERNPKRRQEFALHGNRITKARIERWRSCERLDYAQSFDKIMEIMKEYCDFFSYT